MRKAVLNFGYLMMLASRNSTYNTVTGLCEPIDNSNEPSVKAKNVSVTFGKDENGIIDTIYIADDGASMTRAENVEFWAVDRTDKFDDGDPNSLGKFHLGGKAGPFSFGDKVQLLTKRQNGEIYMSEETLSNYTDDVKPVAVTDDDTVTLFNEKIMGSSHGTLVIIRDLIKDYRITEEEFKQKDDCFKGLSLVYGNFKGVKHTVCGEELEHIDVMGGIDTATGERVMAKVLTQCYKITVGDCPVPLKLITFHRYRNEKDTIEWDFNDWGLLIYRNGRLTTTEPLRDDALFGEKGRSHRQMEFGAILYAESVHDDYLNMPYSKFITSAKKFNTSLLEQLSRQLKIDVGISADKFYEEGNSLTTASLKDKGEKIANNLNSRLQNFKKSAKYKKTSDNEQEQNADDKKTNKKEHKKEHKQQQQKSKRKVKFVNAVNFGDYGMKNNLIDVYYDGNNSWSVNVNTGHPTFKSMKLNDKKVEAMIYYELSLSMAIENTMYTHDEKTSRRLSNNRTELHDLQESFIHEMEAKYNPEEDESTETIIRIRNIDGCMGANITYEEINKANVLTEEMAESEAR